MIFSSFERMMAWRYLRAKKAEGFVSVIAGFSFLGIMLGVATLIIVLSVMNGFRAELLGRIIGLNGHISVYNVRPSDGVAGYDALTEKLTAVGGINIATPIIEKQGLLSANGGAHGVLIRGITPRDFNRNPVLAKSIVSGSLDLFAQGEVAIGYQMARRMNLRVGDELTLIQPEGKASPFGTIPRSGRFKVGAVFNVGMFEYDSNFIFMPLDVAQRFYRMGESVSYLELMTSDPDNLDRVRFDVANIVGDGYRIFDWRDNNASFFNALQVERNVMFLILTLIILVAAFNIISSMIMLVKDKARNIAIMRTMGASRASILRIFILTGSSIGIIGTLSGAVLGIAFAMNIESIRQFIQRFTNSDLFSAEIYFLSQLPAKIDWTEVATVIAMAFSLSLLATLYPAWRAARLNPVEVLRYE